MDAVESAFFVGNVLLQTVQAKLGLLRTQTLATSATTSTLGTRWAAFKSGAAGLSGMLQAAAGGFLSMILAIGATTDTTMAASLLTACFLYDYKTTALCP